MSSTSAVQSCTVCDKENATFCARCKCILYCSKACQQRDWSTHKLLCASFPTFAHSKRPTADHYRAVLFDPNKAKPEFIWLLCKWLQGDDDEVDYQMPETDTIIGSDTFPKHMPIQYNPRLKKPLPNTIIITYRDTFLVDGSRPSKSIASINDTQPGEYHDWRGPIVVYAKKGPGLDPPACKDFDMVDFRHATDYFLSYAYIPPKAQASVECVKGVRINCLGDVKMLKRPHFEEIELPTTDAIFTKHDTSDIANRIGIPILTQRCPLDPKWANSKDAMFEGMSPCNNQDATFLHQCCDPGAKFDISTGSLGWGWCSAPWQSEVGSAIVVRKDKKPLLPMQMEALAGYCRNEIQPLLGHSTGEYHPEEPIKKEDVLKIICRPMFVIYWTKFRRDKEDYTTPSPYDNGL
jgi:hypothetical protein